MPITCRHPIHPLTREEFGRLSFELMRDVFAIRNELGRFFDERFYKQALAHRRQDVILEAPIEVSYQSFEKKYFMDVLFATGSIVEFKATESLTRRHKAQLIHYEMLAGLEHGLLINVRPEQVVKEFVNCPISQAERFDFKVVTDDWPKGKDTLPGAQLFIEVLTQLLQDWGNCLELPLYEEALTHFLGGEATVLRPVDVHFDGVKLGHQAMRLAAERVAFKLTAFDGTLNQERFIPNAHRLMEHTEIDAVLWANLARHEITFRCLKL